MAPRAGEVCPHCGQRVISKRFVINQDENWIERSGKRIPLSSFQIDLIYSLNRARPKPMSTGDLVEHLYAGDDPPKNAIGSIRHTVGRLRPKIAEIGLEIASIHREGYRLDITDDDEEDNE
jgi:DNA-binding response OmpR family regulator